MNPEEIIAKRDAALADMEAINESGTDRALTDDEQGKYDEARAIVQECDEVLSRFRDIDEARAAAYTPEQRQTDAKDAEIRDMVSNDDTHMKVSQARHYGEEGSRHSWFMDLAAARKGDADAHRRLDEFRTEERDLSLSDSAGGYMVTPKYLVDEFVELRRQLAPVAGLVPNYPHPATDNVKIPKMSTGTAVAVASESTAVQETDAVLAEVSVDNFRIAGRQQLSNRLVEFGNGIDRLIAHDLGRAAATKVDEFVITGSGSGEPEGVDTASTTTAVTYTAGTATAAELYPKLLLAIQGIHTSAYEAPDAIVMHPRRAAWLLAQLDSSYRPFLSPVGANNNYGNLDPRHMAGTILGIPVIVSTNVPTTLGSGTDEDEIIVGAWKNAWMALGAPRFAVSVDEAFSEDQTTIRLTQDMMFTSKRVSGAFAKITGTGLNDILS
jgi:HK97 family phage major capsid protein